MTGYLLVHMPHEQHTHIFIQVYKVHVFPPTGTPQTQMTTVCGYTVHTVHQCQSPLLH